MLAQSSKAASTRHSALRVLFCDMTDCVWAADYDWWGKRDAFHDLPPEHPTIAREPVKVTAYLEHLALVERVAPATQAQALNALVFLYREVMQIDLGDLGNYQGTGDRANSRTSFQKRQFGRASVVIESPIGRSWLLRRTLLCATQDCDGTMTTPSITSTSFCTRRVNARPPKRPAGTVSFPFSGRWNDASTCTHCVMTLIPE